MKRIFTFLVFLLLFKTGWAQPSIASEELLPLYMYVGVGPTTTVPYACRLKIAGLTPNATYRYYNRFSVANTTPPTEGGYYIIVKESGFVRNTTAGFTGTRYGELTADGTGSYTGWFVCQAINTSMFSVPGAQFQVTVTLNDGNNGTVVVHRLTTQGIVTLNFSNTTPPNSTALWSTAATGGTAKNFVMLYDNENGTGRPVSGTYIENDGSVNTTANLFAAFYASNVDGVDKTWGTIIPNNLANGIRRIVQHKLSDGTLVGSNVSADGTWPAAGGGTVSTVNATQGFSTPLVLDGSAVNLIMPQTLSFTSAIPSTMVVGDPDLTVTATSTSGLTDLQYTVSPSGILQITGNTVRAIGPGTATITASHPGNAQYHPGSVTSPAIVVKGIQNITFADMPLKMYGDDVFALDVSSDNATIPITATSSDPAVAEVFYETLENRWKVQIHGAGTVDITASQAANSDYQAASVIKSFSVQKKALKIKADNKTREVNTANPALTATYEGFISGEDENDLANPAVLSTTAIQSSPVGEYEILISGAASPNYDITFEEGTLFVVNKLQTITFPAISNKIYGAEAFNPGATSNRGVAPVYTSGNSAVAIIENNEVRIKGAGQVRITVTFPAVDDYAQTTAERTFSVIKKALTITAVDKTKTYGRDNPQLTVQYSGFVYDETSDALATKPVLLTDAVKISPIGSYTITVSGATSVNYDIAYEYGMLSVERAPLRITAENKGKVQGEPNPPLTINYDGFVNGETTAVLNTLATVYTAVENSSPVGEYSITVSGASASNYLMEYHEGTFTVKQKTRTLTFSTLPAYTYGEADFDPGAILSSGETPQYISLNTNVATIVNNKVHIVSAGTTNITVTAPGNSSYENTPTKTQVLVISRAQQFIEFSPVPALSEGTPYTVAVSSSSGLPVTLIIEDSRIVSQQGDHLIPLHAGLTNVTATQDGNINYLPANAFVQRVQVTDAEGNFIAVHQALSINGDGINESLIIDGIENYQENHLVIVNRNGAKVFEVDNYDNQTNAFQGKGNTNYFNELPQGTYFYVLEFKVNTETRRKTGYFVLRY